MEKKDFRIRRFDLDFEDYKAREGRYKIHDYPAMLHYKVVEKLISEYGKGATILYDPFCGSGVSLVEGLKQGKKVIGTDINPLALLIADVRTQNLCYDELIEVLAKIKNLFSNVAADIPRVKNLNYWFKDNVINDLGKLRSVIKLFCNEHFYKFLLVVFSQTVRNVSNNRRGEFKRYRINQKKLESYNPIVFQEFEKIYLEFAEVFYNDSIKMLGEKILLLKDVRTNIEFNADFIITSPPYGDSKTTVAYGEFSSFSLDWLIDLNPYGNPCENIDKLSLGGKNSKNISMEINSHVKEINDKLCYIDKNRAKKIISYFDDLFLACENISKILLGKAKVIFVVGNRKVKGIEIPTDIIIKEYFEALGMKHINTFVRKISNKRMPLLNSPTNKSGEVQETMAYEYIVIMEKIA